MYFYMFSTLHVH